jgi:DDHD domain
MSDPLHTLGPTCIFHDDAATNTPRNSPNPPQIKFQFFYISPIPIDDPLSPLPPISSDTKSSQSHQPRPFSIRDNAALAEAWQGIEHHRTSVSSRDVGSPPRPQIGERGRTLGELVRFPRFKDNGKPSTAASYHNDGGKPVSAVKDSGDAVSGRSLQLASSSSALLSSYETPKKSRHGEGEASLHSAPELTSQNKHRRFSPPREPRAIVQDSALSTVPGRFMQTDGQEDTDISGQPFARAPTSRSMDGQDDQDLDVTAAESRYPRSDTSIGSLAPPAHSKLHNVFHRHKEEEQQEDAEDEKVLIPVGTSRLHLVEMPDLLMKPIYWNPVNDISAVLRGTWFYTANMLPVEPDLANWLEAGYQDLKPWTDTWQDELNSCVEIGAEAEVKVVYHLFPERKSSRPGTGAEAKADSSEHIERDRWPAPEPSMEHENLAAGPRSRKFNTWAPDLSQRYKNHRVIYVNASQAQILRPNLAPSISRNRKPLAAVRRGREIGVPIVRGFNRRAWEKLHPLDKTNTRAAHAKTGAYMSQSGNAETQDRHILCPACRFEEQKRTPQVTDLVLVIHGIGQKLSERMDSFHFTHAINSFRREVNVELSSEVIQGSIRKEQGGIMVLPVNWRLTVSFDDGDDSKTDNETNIFQLADITPDTLPAIRSLISDVMLDIPYYLSHHKQRMISAVIRESNRVYRLWCRNNPGFHDNGRVHLIAHSLGSAMAMDILSQQPTIPPKQLDASLHTVSDRIFEFDTKSLFCCGSPAGFFLLLNKARLVPRGGRHKAGTYDGDDRGATGEAGAYGCLAVDNVYNVMAPYDPISYRMNAAVDSEYAASLKPAIIPSVRQGLLASMGLKWGASSSTMPFGFVSSSASATAQRPTMNKMPSTIEMDTHNFTREELAEKRMYLLNDNGQIDFTLSADGGPLDFQYWNMLSAHSSYWLRQDFVRFLVVEIGREQGRQGTLTALTARKKRAFYH